MSDTGTDTRTGTTRPAGFAPLRTPAAPMAATPVQVTSGPYAQGPVGTARLLPDSSAFVNEFTRPLPDPAAVFAGPGYYSPRTPACGFAAASLVLALAGVVIAVPALLAIVFGHLGVYRTRNYQRTGRGMALGGMVLGYAVTLFWSVLIGTTWLTNL
ncbi:DUF4190 domain-containing protein [Pseudactinotalea sp. Z1748]|uniref:DUF4190 domain-containing protein n=1 Tax=Pseudactinotalea sp. Z1748 TaxID=3413027 RepID=UPI003C7D7252